MRSILRFLRRVFTPGRAEMIGGTAKQAGSTPAPTDVTLLVPAMN
jgi:hypothetical protein